MNSRNVPLKAIGVPLQRIDGDGQVQNDGRDADEVQEHGNGTENVFEVQGGEQKKAEDVGKEQEQDREGLAFVLEIQDKTRNEKGNEQEQGIFQAELPADLLFLEYFRFQKDGVLDQKQLVAAVTQGVRLLDRHFPDDLGAFAAENALSQSGRRIFSAATRRPHMNRMASSTGNRRNSLAMISRKFQKWKFCQEKFSRRFHRIFSGRRFFCSAETLSLKP